MVLFLYNILPHTWPGLSTTISLSLYNKFEHFLVAQLVVTHVEHNSSSIPKFFSFFLFSILYQKRLYCCLRNVKRPSHNFYLNFFFFFFCSPFSFFIVCAKIFPYSPSLHAPATSLTYALLSSKKGTLVQLLSFSTMKYLVIYFFFFMYGSSRQNRKYSTQWYYNWMYSCVIPFQISFVN